MTDQTAGAGTPEEIARAIVGRHAWMMDGSGAAISQLERDIATALRASREAALEEQWQPIETAPKDGTWLLAYSPSGNWRRISWGRNRHGELCWCAVDYYWRESEGAFTHWREIPSPPAAIRK